MAMIRGEIYIDREVTPRRVTVGKGHSPLIFANGKWMDTRHPAHEIKPRSLQDLVAEATVEATVEATAVAEENKVVAVQNESDEQ